MTLKIGELCAGYGGLGMAVEEVFGAELAWVSEFDDAPSKILAHHWPNVPNYGDMTQIDWAAIEPVDIISGGTPCQDLSHAGRRAGMTEGTRSNLWVQMREAIATIQPTYVVWENVRGAYSAEANSDLEPCPGCMGDTPDRGAVLRALGRVLGDLSDLGYDCQWRGLRAADVGAPHGRFRVFILATRGGADVPHPLRSGGGRWAAESKQAWSDDAPQRSSAGGNIARETAKDAHLATRGEWRIPAPGQAEAGRAWTDAGGRNRTPAADAHSGERDGRECYEIGSQEARAFIARGGDVTTPDASSAERRGPQSEHLGTREEPTPEPRECLGGDTAWGDYEPAIQRWESTLGRRAPAPTEPTGRNGGHRLSARFAEWMMGVPDGWIVDVPGISRNEALKAAGNGVVPQ